MRLLVIGGGGQLGTKIVEQARDRFEVYATYLTRKPLLNQSNMFQIDKTNREEVSTILRKIKPQIVIDTAALHNVDYCETHRNEAKLANLEGTKYVAKACNDQNARIIFISTDYVFDGVRGSYTEDDETKPINYYGTTKLEGERAVAQICSNHIVARPSVIYGYVPSTQRESSSGKPLNFAMWLAQKLKNNEPAKIVNDQYSSPTLADNLGETLLGLAESEETGVYHTAGKTRLNRYEFAVRIAQKLDFDEKLIAPIETSQLKQLARRPMDSSLKVEKIENDLRMRMLTIDEALNRFREQFLSGEEK
jgi:dTDP-4-dehydrorhamnose reductase